MSTDFGTNIETVDGLDIKMEPAVVREVQKKAPPKAVIKEKRIRIILEQNDNIPPTGQFFGLNGVGYMLKPGLAADVPEGIVNILNDAVMSVPVIDPTTQQVINFQDRLRFPYRVIAVVPPTPVIDVEQEAA
jgi:hypothetical protein